MIYAFYRSNTKNEQHVSLENNSEENAYFTMSFRVATLFASKTLKT